ncbi:MAG: pentapeptide repeat-containing protein [Saprospiraceae bacterium]|nr:pentapeptide repeat-containing protein [Saprospiraceae bacterium]
MRNAFFEHEKWVGLDYSLHPLEPGEYEQCSFSGCTFLQADLSGILFTGCDFADCDLSMAKLSGTAFREVSFRNSKLLGLRFDECHPFSFAVSFDHCLLQFSSFFRVKLPKTRFRECNLEEVEFVEADLGQAVFDHCDLRGALFEQTNLEGADFRTADHFSIDPENNRIQKARFLRHNIAGLLDKYKIVLE